MAQQQPEGTAPTSRAAEVGDEQAWVRGCGFKRAEGEVSEGEEQQGVLRELRWGSRGEWARAGRSSTRGCLGACTPGSEAGAHKAPTNFGEPTEESRLAFEGRLFDVRVDTVRLANGRRTIREIVIAPDSVASCRWTRMGTCTWLGSIGSRRSG